MNSEFLCSVWNPYFSGLFINDWEVCLVEWFLEAIQGKKVILNAKDRVV